MIVATHKREILKTVSWRIIGTLVVFITVGAFSNFFTAFALAGAVAFSDFFTKTVLYYFHEKVWNKLKYGLVIEEKEGVCIWLTGLPCSGKTTIALGLVDMLNKDLHRTEYLDGDIVRKSVCSDLGFTKEDRDENIKRITLVASFLVQKAVTICSFVSPYAAARDKARKATKRFVEVYVACPVDVCVKRDVKGMYAKALNGEIKGFTGIDAPYEAPSKPEITCYTDKESVNESVDKVLSYLKAEKLI